MPYLHRLKVSVCTGALLLGAAGFLKGKRATTHPNNFRDLQPSLPALWTRQMQVLLKILWHPEGKESVNHYMRYDLNGRYTLKRE